MKTETNTETNQNEVEELMNTIEENLKNTDSFDTMEKVDVEDVVENETRKISVPTTVRRKKKKVKQIPLLKVVKFAEKFSSTGAAFILATLGIITQTFHNGFLFFELSSFDNVWLNLLQTTIGAFGLSGALLYFTIRAANGGSKIVRSLVWAFFIFEIYANLYYWSNKYIISVWGTADVNWSTMIIAVPFAFMIPFTIKAYAGELNFQGLLDEEDEYEDVDIQDSTEAVKEIMKSFKQDVDLEVESMRDFTVGQMSDFNDRIEDIEEDTKNSIKIGEKFNLNIDTKDKDGKETTKVLTSVISK